MKKAPAATGKPVLDVIDDAIALLRRCPASTGILYYIGAVPFILGFLYFWADMSRGAFAADHLIEWSLLMAAGFVWCKFWQAIFGAHLLALAGGQAPPRWTWRKLLRLLAAQAPVQPTGLFILPVAALITLPLAAAAAFYQNFAILSLDASGEVQDTADLRREALRQARRWPAQNNIGLATLLFFGLAVFADVVILILVIPSLLKTLLGIDSMYSRSMFSMLNTTLLVTAAGITYLCVDPILKAFYTLRCFHGRAISTGEDLRLQLRLLTARRLATVAAVVLLACCGAAQGALAAATGGAPPRTVELDRSISRVLDRPEFAWRAPRDEAGTGQKTAVDGFLQNAAGMIGRWLQPVKHMIRRFIRWIGKRMNRRDETQPPDNPGGGSWMASLQFFAWVFCAAAAVILGVILWKIWKRRTPALEVMPEPLSTEPDLRAEEVAADQLPGDQWLQMAQSMIERGELRLALRAFYLASLAHLGERQIISIARYKSNHDYKGELRRRRPGQPELWGVFSETVSAFERAWYGMHDVTPDILHSSKGNLEKIRES